MSPHASARARLRSPGAADRAGFKYVHIYIYIYHIYIYTYIYIYIYIHTYRKGTNGVSTNGVAAIVGLFDRGDLLGTPV